MLPPDTLIQGRYLIVEAIGQGGMGAVYKATDTRLRNTVALKETILTGDVAQRAFEREAQLLAGLRHPSLPKVSDHFADERGTFLVMEFIPGKDLAALLAARGAPFPVSDVLRWADQLLDVLEYLHTHQPPIIHRDIKPQNLKLTDRNEIILLDFGLAKGTVTQTRLTTASVFGYTPHFAPLEQIQGVGTDPRSDLYSLAATLYQLLTNQIPADALRRAAAKIADDPDPLEPPHELNPSVPEPVSAVLMQALAQKPADRPPTAAALRGALHDALEGVGPMASSSGLATIVQGGTPGGIVRVKPNTTPPGGPQAQPAPRMGAASVPGTRVLSDDTVMVGATPQRRPPVWMWAAGAAAVALVVLAAFLALGRGSGSQQAGATPPPPPPPSDTTAPTATLGPPTATIDILMAAAATQTTQAQREADMLATARMLLDETAGAATQTAVALIPTDTPLPATETVAPSDTAGPTATAGPTRTPRPTAPPTATPTIDTNPPTATAAPTNTPQPVAAGEVLSLGNGSLFRASVDIAPGSGEGQGGSCIQGRVTAADGGTFSRFGVQVDNRGNTRQASVDASGGTYSICGLGEGEWGVSVFTAGGVDIPASEQVAHQVRVRLSGRAGEIFFINFRAQPAFAPPSPTPTPLVGPYDGQWSGKLSGKTAGDVDFNGSFRMEVRANAVYSIAIDGPSCLFETYPNFPNGLALSGASFSLNGSPFHPTRGTDGSITFSINGSFASTSTASGLLNASQNGGSCAVATWSATRR